MFSLTDADIIRNGGLAAVVMLLIYIARLMRTGHVKANGEESAIEAMRKQITAQGKTISELSNKIDDQRKECAEEIRARDAQILALERQVNELKGRLTERDRIDEMGRTGQIERRRSQLVGGAHEGRERRGLTRSGDVDGRGSQPDPTTPAGAVSALPPPAQDVRPQPVVAGDGR